jgi:23S rRNA pseudouridine1911/1915/1917 synthase
MDRVELQVRTDERKKRLEDFLFDRFSGLSKMYLREIVKNEKCEVNGRFENIGYKLRANDFVEIELDLSRENAMQPQEMPLDIVFEDEHLIVVNKPEGVLVHPTHRDKSGTLLNGLTFYLNAEGGERNSEFIRPGLIHRLDKATSGLMVVAKNGSSHRILASHFMKKLVEKRYLAVVEGVVESDEGTIEAPIGRYAEQKFWDVKQDGKLSVTKFWVRERFVDSTLLELEPVTGRTNQLRIHCASIGHPIVGDMARGGREFVRLCLHAYRLAFRHPVGREMMKFEAPDFGYIIDKRS